MNDDPGARAPRRKDRTLTPDRAAPRGLEVRPYRPDDAPAWLRCRALSFLQTAYFDDVLVAKPTYHGAPIELVACDGPSLVGVIDVSAQPGEATIETIAVHPDWMRRGVGSALLDEVRTRLPATVRTLDAWTRDDEQANGWYQRQGFAETFRYLHVYAISDAEVEAAIVKAGHGLTPARAFFHAGIAAEAALRGTFERVHVCRRYELVLATP